MRTYGEAVDVRPARPDLEGVEAVDGLEDAEAAAPGQFLWRGRLYVVRAVLAHWVELGPWWTGQTGTGSTGTRAIRPTRGAPARSSLDHAAVDAWSGARAAAARTAVGEPEPQPPERPARSVAHDVGAVEREVWRVEARAGRSSSVGVYDLVRDVPPPDPASRGSSGSSGSSAGAARSRWRLARALD